METLSGRTLADRYYLRKLVGSGGMADVYLAWDQLRNAKMAVKILRRDLSSDPQFFDRFATEAKFLKTLEHPNIVRLYDFKREDEIAFIVMQWVDGSNLRQVLTKSRNALPLEDCSRVLSAVCSALHFAHGNKIYHCDIKPANIMLDIKGNSFDTLLTDFGVSQLAGQASRGGTPTYMSPEQFMGGVIDVRTDVYALGVTLYEILSGGNAPYSGLSLHSEGSTTRERIAWEHLNFPPPRLTSINPGCSQAIENVVLTAMEKNPENRYPSVMSFFSAFEQARSTTHTNTAREPSNLEAFISQFTSQAKSGNTTIFGGKFGAGAKPGSAADDKVLFPERGFFNKPLDKGLNVAGREPILLERSGLHVGRQLTIPMGETSIGRGSQAQIKLEGETVSRQHATLIRTKRAVYIRDDQSSFGTFINGVRIFKPTQLNLGDIVQIGSQQVFEYTRG